MKTKIEKLDLNKVVTLLKKADWNYEHCGDRIKDGDMDEYIAELEEALNNQSAEGLSELITHMISDEDLNDADSMRDSHEDLSSEEAILMVLGDRIAGRFIDCVYSTVTFHCNP